MYGCRIVDIVTYLLSLDKYNVSYPYIGHNHELD